MNERRRFLHVLGAGAATLVIPGCGGGSNIGGLGGAGGSGEGGGSPGSGSAGTGTAAASSGSTSSGSTASSSGATSASSSTGGGPGCEMNPVGVAVGTAAAFATKGLHKGPLGSHVLIGRDAGGLYALSSICTHQSCDLDGKDQGQQAGTIMSNGIQCNCHGSQFDTQGNVVQGPAQFPLEAYALVLGCDGHLYADSNTVVPSTNRLKA